MGSSIIYTNSSGQDQVQKPYTAYMARASRIRIAVPYFTRELEIMQAAARGASIELLVGLNRITNPSALRRVLDTPNCSVRYFTDGFHAKIFLFDDVAMLGSANLTEGGISSNREAVVVFDQLGDEERMLSLEIFFAQVWESAEVLTQQVFKQFRDAWDKASRLGSPDAPFQVLRDVEPPSVLAGSEKKSARQYFLSNLQKSIYEQYRPAFAEVSEMLHNRGSQRAEFVGFDPAFETNRFLNWVRLEHAVGDASWQDAPLRSEKDRRHLVGSFVEHWISTTTPHIPEDYFQMLAQLQRVMGKPESISASSQEQLAHALICVHAFKQQLRFTLGGEEALPEKFWELNHGNLLRVKSSLINLVHGDDDFAERICSVLYDQRCKIGGFGRFCALELVGTIKPEQVPPINGRMAKALRYLGYDVLAT
ncbi:phospholipase D family protein [Pseudomonas siliginis]|uniref:phospholipase D family protein n=1 Tax=Pseudomonas siliginis TaxID=2842346 RepID=UPI001C3CF8AB|nr:phospholipase D family protein [Pseudomonas siliginis]MBV4469934.1 phospholipase D family protein [Pseudomonas siliginis]